MEVELGTRSGVQKRSTSLTAPMDDERAHDANKLRSLRLRNRDEFVKADGLLVIPEEVPGHPGGVERIPITAQDARLVHIEKWSLLVHTNQER